MRGAVSFERLGIAANFGWSFGWRQVAGVVGLGRVARVRPVRVVVFVTLVVVFVVVVLAHRRANGGRDEGHGNGIAVIVRVMTMLMIMIMTILMIMIMVVVNVIVPVIIMIVIVLMIMVVMMLLGRGGVGAGAGGVFLAADFAARGRFADRRLFARLGARGGGFCLGATAGVTRGETALFLFFLPRDFRHEPFAVGDGDLVVVGMNFAEGEEAVPVPAVVDKGRLEGWLNPDHFGQVDIAFDLLLGGCFYIEFFKTRSVQYHNPGFLRVSGFDKHSLDHSLVYSVTPRCPRGPGSMDPDARVRSGVV